MSEHQHIIVDEPRPGVSRITLNRPDARNALNNILRGEIYATLEANDNNPAIKVTIIRGAGKAFCAGYDLKGNNSKDQPFHTSGGDGNWARHVVDGFFRVWDLAKPVIAQVHGYCLAGGTELATSCDLVYVAEDAQIGYPVVRS
ncbi:MAG: enoyl-CoA hydratase, partial [Candidatus Azotimanducaceae bacterium]